MSGDRWLRGPLDPEMVRSVTVDPDSELGQAIRRELLIGHGYDPDASPSGVPGPPRTWQGTRVVSTDPYVAEPVTLRPHVCQLDGVLIDGHEASDLDPGGGCMLCDED